MVHHRRSVILVALLVSTAACERADRWGTPAYFERLVGHGFTPASAPISCYQGSFVDFVAYKRTALPAELAEALRLTPGSLERLPEQLADERDRTLRRWSPGPLSAEAREAFEFALAGAMHAVEKSGCRGVVANDVRFAMLRSLERRGTTLYSYQWQSVDGRVLPEALEFRILDLVDGVLHELVNFS